MGGVHCVGMCGGIVVAFTSGIEERSGRGIGLHLTYNIGRVASYTIAGALAGGLGAAVAEAGALGNARIILFVLANLFLCVLGLYLTGFTSSMALFERLGQKLWRHVEPLGRKILPVRSGVQAFTLGLLWGWLPCGLVYGVLASSLASASLASGALVMLAFGLGTLPNLLLAGVLAGQMRRLASKVWLRRLAGGIVFAYGLFGLIKLWHKMGGDYMAH